MPVVAKTVTHLDLIIQLSTHKRMLIRQSFAVTSRSLINVGNYLVKLSDKQQLSMSFVYEKSDHPVVNSGQYSQVGAAMCLLVCDILVNDSLLKVAKNSKQVTRIK